MQGERFHSNAQDAIDDALAGAAQGIAQYVKLVGEFNETITIPPFASAPPKTEKVLLPKPHPEGCPCPKCPQDPPLPGGIHLLPSGRVRVGDSDKDIYLDRLRAAFSDGRLTDGEFTARQDAVLAAVTFPELDLLCRDLPGKKEEPAVIPYVPAKEKEHAGLSVFRFVVGLVMVSFPFMAGIGILGGGAATQSAVLALIGGVAAVLMVILGGFSR